MSAVKDWESKRCVDNDCPTSYGHELNCDVCEGLRRDGFRAGVQWVKGLFDANTASKKPVHDIHVKILEELCEG